MEDDLLRDRAALWRARAAQATDPRERAACEEIATRYEGLADLPATAPPAPDDGT